MEIERVSIIGLGALGILFGHHLATHMPEGSLRVIADADRIDRYRREGIYSNDKACSFHYVTPQEPGGPADLLLFAVKFGDLEGAIRAAENHVGPNTVILSLLNGISSEEIIGRKLGQEKVLLAVAQGMDAVKAGNRLRYVNMGMICFGDPSGQRGNPSERVHTVARFFEKTKLPYEVSEDMPKKMWGKFMLNVGVNQTLAVFPGGYETVLREGPARETMIAAMREVMALSEKENICLTESDLDYWLRVLAKLDPRGMPSMSQDLQAGRRSEVELFAGTVLRMGKKHGLSFPTNRWLYNSIMEIESRLGAGHAAVGGALPKRGGEES